MVKFCVFFAVRTEFLNIIQTSFGLYADVLLHQMYWNLSIKSMALKLGKPRELPYYIDCRTAG
jgi:hypothetical protein